MPMRACLLGIALCLSAATGVMAADAQDDLHLLLSRPLISQELALKEVQLFAAARVAPLASVTTLPEWQAEAARLRTTILERVVFRGEAASWRDARTRVEWLDSIPGGAIPGGPGYRIRKLRYEALPGVWIPALLYEPERLVGKVPVHLALHGHERPLGKAAPYKQIRCINLAKRGMIVLSPEWLATGQLRTDNWDHDRLKQLDLCGASGLAPFFLCMQRGLDLLLSVDHADPERVAVSGESGGGWQTIFLAALDTRVTLANPVAGYAGLKTGIGFHDVGDSEQLPCDFGAVADYTHLTALMAPRPILITVNARDNCCFVAANALPPVLDAATPVYRLHDKIQHLRWHVNHDPGTHNYDVDNRQALYQMLGDHFYPADPAYETRELPCADEIKTAEELAVPLPTPNGDFNTLALSLSERLPRGADLPEERPAAERWQKTMREKLREVVHAKDYTALPTPAGRDRKGELEAAYWWLKMGDAWTVPAVELTRRADGDPQARSKVRPTAILVADEGRTKAASTARQLLDAGYRVLAVDPFSLGESWVDKRTHPARYRSEYTILVDAIGERPLGLQASQLAAVARWSRGEQPNSPVTLVGSGPRASLTALVAAALEEQAIAGVEIRESFGSLKEILENNWTASKTPEVFCFGLLESFDIKQLAALVAPRPVKIAAPSARAKAELGLLKTWYQRLGSEFDPFR